MELVIVNPYANHSTTWLKGQLHTHTNNSDGDRSPQDIVNSYAERGYDFLMISDHDRFTDPESLNPRGMALLPGNEVSANGPHLLHVGAHGVVAPASDRQEVLDEIGAHGGIAIMCHPNWQEHFNHCPQQCLETWQGYVGIEICNGICCALPGSGLALDRWDRLLAGGRRIWGYANDDTHEAQHDGFAWNMVQCEHRDANAIMEALRDGRFYASTGVTIEQIDVDDSTIRVLTRNAQRIIAIGDSQRRVAVADSNEMSLRVSEEWHCSYVRLECWGSGEQMAWTQPFFISRK